MFNGIVFFLFQNMSPSYAIALLLSILALTIAKRYGIALLYLLTLLGLFFKIPSFFGVSEMYFFYIMFFAGGSVIWVIEEKLSKRST